jgi:hypothetical protein
MQRIGISPQAAIAALLNRRSPMRQATVLASTARPSAHPAGGVAFNLWPFRLLWRVVLMPLGNHGGRRRVHAYTLTLFGCRTGLAVLRWEEHE